MDLGLIVASGFVLLGLCLGVKRAGIRVAISVLIGATYFEICFWV